ncbi:hypothetical protein [Dyadobacter sp. NIV53]|uniref:hypothetical protein n=1 Tax=Dyadobacter sp. NIV53 TaxID=2861765 RepID=UPI001C87E7AD|nr:hypothetical protein [Dyadobacter sp. NIV53]
MTSTLLMVLSVGTQVVMLMAVVTRPAVVLAVPTTLALLAGESTLAVSTEQLEGAVGITVPTLSPSSSHPIPKKKSINTRIVLKIVFMIVV